MANTYWFDRQNRLMEKAEISEKEYLRSLSSLYRTSIAEIEAIINEMYAKYGKDGKLTFQQLSTIDEKRRLSRLEAMKLDINTKISSLTRKTQSKLKKQMMRDYSDSFMRTKYNLQTYMGFGASFTLPPTKQIEKVVDSRWVDERNYSERLWVNRTKLVQSLFDAVGQTIARGLSAQQCAAMIQKEMDSSYSSAIRLARTEINHICNEATVDAYKDEGIEYYQFLATLDDRTSEICMELDGQIFPITEKRVGINCPPMHPNCRSTIVPVINIDKSTSKYDISHIDEEGNKRTETGRGKVESQVRVSMVDGKYKYVPGDITYKQWERKYIEEKSEEDILTHIEELKKLSQEDHKESIITNEYTREPIKVDQTLVDLVSEQMLVKYDKVEASITGDMLEVSMNNGLPTEGMKYRLKEDDSLSRKIGQEYANEDGKKSIIEVARNMGDVERYTFILPEDKFADNLFSIKKDLEGRDYTFARIKNTFTSEKASDYKGINCILFNKDGYPLEVQFHTQDSFDAKMLNHQYYEWIRTGRDSEGNVLTEEKKDEYLRKQADNNKIITKPDKISEVENLNPKTKVNDLRQLFDIDDPFEDLGV